MKKFMLKIRTLSIYKATVGAEKCIYQYISIQVQIENNAGSNLRQNYDSLIKTAILYEVKFT